MGVSGSRTDHPSGNWLAPIFGWRDPHAARRGTFTGAWLALIVDGRAGDGSLDDAGGDCGRLAATRGLVGALGRTRRHVTSLQVRTPQMATRWA